MNQPIVTITKVRKPWYVLPFILRRAFKKAVPEYQKIEGLKFKYFATTNDGKHFGGIYLWETKEKAAALFSEKWFEAVRRRFKTEGIVNHYTLQAVADHTPVGFDFQTIEKNSVAIFIQALSDGQINKFLMTPQGLLRAYTVNSKSQLALILLFNNRKLLDEFVENNFLKNYEIYFTPVLLKNGL
jgi:hypothetical protein